MMVDLHEARAALARERRSTLESIDALASNFDDFVASSREVAIDDEHDPEGHTIAFERQQLSSLLESAHVRLVEIDRALARLDARTYGTCEICGHAIPDDRLMARPAARMCVSCAIQTQKA
jgi:RNA polymerase-binding transcription factor DksA